MKITIITDKYSRDSIERNIKASNSELISECVVDYNLDLNGTTHIISNFLLIIEDEFKYYLDIISAAIISNLFDEIVVCEKKLTAESFINKTNIAPVVCTIDFKMGLVVDLYEDIQPLYQTIKTKFPKTIVIGYTNFENQSKAVISDQAGRLVKLFRAREDSVYDKYGMSIDTLATILRNQLQIKQLKLENEVIKTENKKLSSKLELASQALPEESGKPYIIGKSFSMRIVYNELLKLKNVDDVRVLVLGESGTGKELIAKAIYEDSPRGQNKELPYLEVNCKEISEDVNSAISKLFGHKKGSYSGAIADKKGIFELANNGTVFLDEIGKLPTAAQEILLRFLESGKFNRLGEDNIIRHADVRLIFATDSDLNTLVKAGQFKESFLGRIAERSINLPPLRDRVDDIPELANYFINNKKILKSKFNDNTIKFRFNEAVFAILKNYTYSTNVRKLKSLIVNSMIEAKFKNTIINRELIITEDHILQAAERTGLDVLFNLGHNKSNCEESKEFLNKIENILIEHFKDNNKVTEEQIIENFSSTKTNKHSITRQTFTNDELNPRKIYIKKLIKENPSQWPNAITKCQFIINIITPKNK
ncbi:MAG: sigma-54-dependent transcriptional regulator [Ignavibacteriaceae bacterium]